jgi:hypothetical protein
MIMALFYRFPEELSNIKLISRLEKPSKEINGLSS